MHAASFLVAFVFLGVATAGVIPDTAGRNTTAPGDMGGKGDHTALMSSLPSKPPGPPTGASIYPIPSNVQDPSHPPGTRGMGANAMSAHSFYPMSDGLEPTGTLGAATGAPTGPPYSGGESHSPPPPAPTFPHSFHPMSDGPEPTGTPGSTDLPNSGLQSHPPPAPSSGGYTDFPGSGMSGPSGTPPDNSTKPTGTPQPYRPDFPSGASDYPLPSGVRGHKSGSPPDESMSIPPAPTPSDA